MKAHIKIFYLFIFLSLTLCQACPANCVCENEEEEEMCTGCQPGYYDLDDSCNKECDKCPDKECDENGKCSKEGDCIGTSTYGEKCDESCELSVAGCSLCHKNGQCFECSDSRKWGDNCDKECPNCPQQTCDFYGKCNVEADFCDDSSYYGEMCNTPCKNNGRDYCTKCRKVSGVCTECSDSHYGEECSEDCSKCPNGECYMNGECSTKADTCKDPTYTGTMCNQECKVIIPNCDKCLMDSTQCTECQKSFYNSDCKSTCTLCPESNCHMDGICNDLTTPCENPEYTEDTCSVLCKDIHTNCKECHRNNTCTSCINKEFFGDACDESCENCPGFCDINGICENKKDDCDNTEYTGDTCSVLCKDIHSNCHTCHRNNTCTSCINREFFGDACDESCKNCPGSCDINGICENKIDDCDNTEYTGDDCSVLCKDIHPNCNTCHRNNTCTSCINKEFFGEACDESCENCPGICDINGICENKKDDCDDNTLTGIKCDELCSKNVSNCYKCNRENICSECINRTKFGPDCNTSCGFCPGNKLCDINGNCDDQTSVCTNDLYTGANCSVLCSSVSKCLRCDRNQHCLECIDKEFYGNNCSNSCANCPPGGCDINGICVDDKSLCDDDTLTGPSCDYPCFDLHKDGFCKRCTREGKCTECSNIRYHGENCSLGCEDCSDTGCNIQGYCREFKCENSTYGLGCEHQCTCGSNSDDTDCGKFGGQCLSCKFGYYGKTCQDQCYYKCQTELCCIFKKDKIDSKLEIKTNYKYIYIDINGTLGKFEIDYNYGFPLTIFNYSTYYEPSCHASTIKNLTYNESRKRDSYEMNFTNYYVNASIFNDQVIKINNKRIEGVDITVAHQVNCSKADDKNGISGIIGLGFFNSISNSYYSNKNLSNHELNILSYFLKGDEVQLYFGNMFKEQIDYVDRLTSCDVILDSESDIQGKKMTCKLDGIKNAKYTEAFELKDAFITFSLGEQSSLILGNNTNYENYIEKIYFKKNDYKIKYEDRDGTLIKYYSYDSERINKLPNFGFVFNKFYYTYSPDKFFKDESDNKKRFLIEINKNSSRTEFVIGKEFLEDIKFTINNEEAKIYFYAKNAEYSDKFTSEVNDNTFVLNLDAKESAAVSLSIIIFINLAAFSIFYCVKRRKMMNSGDYNRLD